MPKLGAGSCTCRSTSTARPRYWPTPCRASSSPSPAYTRARPHAPGLSANRHAGRSRHAIAEQVGRKNTCPGRDYGKAPAPKWTKNVHHQALSLLADGATIRNPGATASHHKYHAGRRACRRRATPPLPRDRASHPSRTVLAKVVCPTPCAAASERRAFTSSL